MKSLKIKLKMKTMQIKQKNHKKLLLMKKVKRGELKKITNRDVASYMAIKYFMKWYKKNDNYNSTEIFLHFNMNFIKI